MREKLNVTYRSVAEEFARRVVSALGGEVHSIVLYGSVARGEAKRHSDIDLLVVSKEKEVKSCLSGTVIYSGKSKKSDFLIIIKHKNYLVLHSSTLALSNID